MTQIDLAEKLNYSDKAISKWERAESLPDIAVIKTIADLFGVTVDYLLESEHKDGDLISEELNAEEMQRLLKKRNRKHTMITAMSMLFVMFIALIIFIVLDVSTNGIHWHWISFIYGISASMIVWIVFNSLWFDKRRNYLIISFLAWSLLCAIHLTVLSAGFNLWQLYLLGIPGQLIIILWSVIGRKI